MIHHQMSWLTGLPAEWLPLVTLWWRQPQDEVTCDGVAHEDLSAAARGDTFAEGEAVKLQHEEAAPLQQGAASF